MENIIIEQKYLEKIDDGEFVTEDMQSNPNLFPLHLFAFFRKTFCKGTTLENEQSSYYSRKSVFCRNNEGVFPEGYQSWFIATTRWNHVSFYFQIGRNNFTPFVGEMEYAKNLDAYIKVQAFAGKISISNQISYGGTEFSVLLFMNKIAEQIIVEMKKYELIT